MEDDGGGSSTHELDFAIHFFRATFARVALVPYVGGTIFHALRLVFDLPIEDMPYELDWVVVVLGGYACAGFIRFAREVRFTGPWDKLLYGLVTVHLGGSVVMHGRSLVTRNHDWAKVFPRAYSGFAVAYFVVFGLYCFRLSRRLAKANDARP